MKMMCASDGKVWKRASAGFSLVEVLVAATVLSMSVIAVVTVVRKGRELEIGDNHRRAARAVIERIMEEQYTDRHFSAIVGGVTESTVTLDERDGNHLAATLRQTVVENAGVPVASGAYIVPTSQVTVSVWWQEADGVADTITIQRWVAKVRPPGPVP